VARYILWQCRALLLACNRRWSDYLGSDAIPFCTYRCYWQQCQACSSLIATEGHASMRCVEAQIEEQEMKEISTNSCLKSCAVLCYPSPSLPRDPSLMGKDLESDSRRHIPMSSHPSIKSSGPPMIPFTSPPPPSSPLDCHIFRLSIIGQE
jgi:hypothetical protein